MKSVDDLIYELVFSDKLNFVIDISEYVDNIYQHDEFTHEIKAILKRSKVRILKSNILLDSKTVIWELKVKR